MQRNIPNCLTSFIVILCSKVLKKVQCLCKEKVSTRNQVDGQGQPSGNNSASRSLIIANQHSGESIKSLENQEQISAW